MSHEIQIDDANGELIDIVNVCTDSCNRTYCVRVELTYQGWSGCHELEHTDYCANCGVVLPGFAGDSNGESCADQDSNIVVARFRSDDGEKCERHNGRHWIQLPASMLIDS
jgi:hypothetical protein